MPFFFILSGFILTYAHADMQFERTATEAIFRRALLAALSGLFAGPRHQHPFRRSFFALRPTGISSFCFRTWFPGSGATDWNFVAWTLSVELFFYLVFPFALIVLRALPEGGLLVALATTIAVLLLIWLNMTPQLGDGEVVVGRAVFPVPVPLLRLPEFIYGACLATLFLRGSYKMPGLTPYVAVLIILAASAAAVSPPAQTLELLAFGPLIFSLASASKTDPMRSALDNRGLVLLGGASYALYLLQFSMRKYVAFWVPDHLAIYARVAFAPLLICVSVIVFLSFETPMRRWLRKALD